MVIVRSIAIFILILAVMPWGAYTTARAAQIQQQTRIAAAIHDTDQIAASPDTQQTVASVAPMRKRCHGPALLGSPCGPYATIPASTVPLSPVTSVASVLSGVGTLPSGGIPRGTLDPPRSC